jgi:hypothetical protein
LAILLPAELRTDERAVEILGGILRDSRGGQGGTSQQGESDTRK